MLVRHSYGSGAWALPGGGCGRNEDPDEAIRREIREELAVELVDLELLVAMEETISGAPHTAYVFAAQLSGEPVRDGREIIAAQFFDLDALPSPLSIFAERRLAYWQGRAAAGAL